jgi:hypothetical protein
MKMLMGCQTLLFEGITLDHVVVGFCELTDLPTWRTRRVDAFKNIKRVFDGLLGLVTEVCGDVITAVRLQSVLTCAGHHTFE